MPIDVRLIRPEEIGPWTQSVSVPFLDPANTEDTRTRWDGHWRPHVEIGRTWAAEDRGRFVGNACIFSRTVTLPAAAGGTCPAVPMAAISAVGVHPTHRRRRLLRRLMAAMLADARQRGEAVAGLFASEAAIYGRFGFGLATLEAHYVLATRESGFDPPAPAVELDLLSTAEAAKVLPGMFARACAHQPGQVDRTDAVWAQMFEDAAAERAGASALSYVVAPGGFAAWRTEQVVEPHDEWGRAALRFLVGDTAGTEAALWRFVLDLDLVGEVVASPRPVDEPIRYRLTNARALRTRAVTDGLWLRVLDPAAALSARGYLRSGRLVLDVRPPPATPTGPEGIDGPDPAVGRWLLDVGPDGPACRRATAAEPTDLVLGVAELGALLAGGIRASVLADAGRVDEERSGALDRADGLFVSRPAPINMTRF